MALTNRTLMLNTRAETLDKRYCLKFFLTAP